MASLNEILDKTPKWALVAGGVVLIGLLGYGMYYVVYGSSKQEEATPEKVVINMPDAEVSEYNTSVLEEMNRSSKRLGRNSVEDYWESLDGGMGGGSSEADRLALADNLDPAVYSEYERLQIRNGLKTKDEIDREHALDAQRRQELEKMYSTAGGSGYTAKQTHLTAAQQDSIYTARLQKAYEMAAKYSAKPQAAAPEAQAAPATPEEEQERKLDLSDEEESVIPVDSWSDDGIITSLETSSQSGVVHYGGAVKAKPVKATFLKNETLVNGNRVIIRLMEDLILSDGTVIPSGKHITGTCSLGRRMKINVNMLHYGDRMFPVDISVYDNDGTEGIY